jgi:hypothetical protein
MRFMLTTAAFMAAVAVLAAAILPMAPVGLDPAGWTGPTPLAGAFHVHTRRSDGAWSVDEVAAAAAAAGLDFVVFADHGDGTRPPDPPAYRSRVLCLDGVEISTEDGHYVAIGLPQAPYPLGGEARDVAEDVARLGGFGVAAHPGSRKPDLAWRDWQVPVDGIEWLNADSEWRDESRRDLARVALASFLRPAGALAELFDRPEEGLARWDALQRERPTVGLAGTDAHGPVRLRQEQGDGGIPLGVPSYAGAFGALTVRALPAAPMTGNALEDAGLLLEAVRRGRVFTAIDALAGPARLEFTARSGGEVAQMGGRLSSTAGIRIEARVVAPPSARIVLLRDGRIVEEAAAPSLVHHAAPEPGSYRVEVRLPSAPGTPPVPWIVSNPIHIGDRSGAVTAPVSGPASEVSLLADGAGEWAVERDPQSSGRSERSADALVFSFALSAGGSSPYAALAREVSAAGYDRVILTADADRPMRVSVQLRTLHEGRERRWRRSVYLSPEPRLVVLSLGDFRPVDRGAPAVRPDDVRWLLLVVDTVNAAPGVSGIVRVHDLRLAGTGTSSLVH